MLKRLFFNRFRLSHSALSSYGLFAPLALWQLSDSVCHLVQAFGSCLASGARLSSVMPPSLGRDQVTTTAKLKLQTHYYVTKGVSKFRRS